MTAGLRELRRRWFTWRLRRAWRAERQLARYTERLGPEYRVHHGERPRLTGYRRR